MILRGCFKRAYLEDLNYSDDIHVCHDLGLSRIAI